jgi:hypothetical protein
MLVWDDDEGSTITRGQAEGLLGGRIAALYSGGRCYNASELEAMSQAAIDPLEQPFRAHRAIGKGAFTDADEGSEGYCKHLFVTAFKVDEVQRDGDGRITGVVINNHRVRLQRGQAPRLTPASRYYQYVRHDLAAAGQLQVGRMAGGGGHSVADGCSKHQPWHCPPPLPQGGEVYGEEEVAALLEEEAAAAAGVEALLEEEALAAVAAAGVEMEPEALSDDA